MVPWTSPSMYRSSLPRTSPLINNVDVMMPPEGCTTSAVNPATLRTAGGSTRGADAGADVGALVGASDAGTPGFESSGLRHMFFPQPKTPWPQGWGSFSSPERTVTCAL